MTGERRAAIVTGAGSGIGAAVAARLLADGWQVALAGRREQALRETATAAGDTPGEALAVATDVTDPAAVQALFARVRDTWGRVDLLFNNAGVNAPAVPVEELPVATWLNVINANVTGVFLCTRAVAYTATKHAVTGLTRAIALEGRPFSIACGQIDIGNAATALAAHIGQGTLQADGSIAQEPMMDLGHAADAVIHMAGLPLEANVLFMTIMATTMPFVGRG
jgi:NAD(P)-dependent dehydrogenase (short-subunit alcohol dehydrogenase family)